MLSYSKEGNINEQAGQVGFCLTDKERSGSQYRVCHAKSSQEIFQIKKKCEVLEYHNAMAVLKAEKLENDFDKRSQSLTIFGSWRTLVYNN